jgi:hypothetical protein
MHTPVSRSITLITFYRRPPCALPRASLYTLARFNPFNYPTRTYYILTFYYLIFLFYLLFINYVFLLNSFLFSYYNLSLFLIIRTSYSNLSLYLPFLFILIITLLILKPFILLFLPYFSFRSLCSSYRPYPLRPFSSFYPLSSPLSLTLILACPSNPSPRTPL